MTCLVGLEHDGAVYLAGDSCVCIGEDQWARCREPKVRAAHGLCWGASGSGRACDVAMAWEPPRYPGKGDRWRWLVTEALPRLQQALADADAGKLTKVDLLIGVAGRLYRVADGCAFSDPRGYAAIGVEVACGAALGSMAKAGWRTPRRRLETALEAATEVGPWCREPFVVVRA